jgi:predicted kinase
MENKVGIFFIMGTTCAGKSTFLDDTLEKYKDDIGVVQVGKLLRAKYPPEYFEGQAAPEKTKIEAWNICYNTTNELVEEGKSIILIDGQPRDEEQTELCINNWNESQFKKHFILLDAPLVERKSRLADRFDKEDPDYLGNLKLAQDRLEGDAKNYFYVLKTLIYRSVKDIQCINTFQDRESYNKQIFSLFQDFL